MSWNAFGEIRYKTPALLNTWIHFSINLYNYSTGVSLISSLNSILGFKFDPPYAETELSFLWKHCRCRLVGFWRSHLIRIHTVFFSDWKYMPTTEMLQVNDINIGEKWSTLKYPAWQRVMLYCTIWCLLILSRCFVITTICLKTTLSYNTILEDFENASPYFCTFLANRICDWKVTSCVQPTIGMNLSFILLHYNATLLMT